MLKIHHLVASRSDRIVWLAEELEIPYELVRHLRNPQTFRAPDSLRAITPLAKAPVIEDQGVVVSESSVICDYLIDQYGQGRLRPSAGTPARLDYAYWMASSESTLMYPVLIDVLSTMTQSDAAGLLGFAMGEYTTMFGHVERTLGKHAYIAGDSFTAADVMVYYTLAMAAGTALPIPSRAPMADYPLLGDYLARLEARPAWQKANKLCAA
ncbi:glutathione S-transferase family protein [Nevskia ramosa]|uniref:glutathione S-transferase family protein n=1 Tax=Nevskia ramosa TaxID=64002 RepID=UPI003D10107A